MPEPEAAATGDDVTGPQGGEELQFDQAEYTTPLPAGPICGGCKRPIADQYYEINGKIVCPECRHRIEASFHGGSRFVRVVKAFLFGSVAAVAGAVLYYVILRVTNINFGLVSVLVGFMVGTAVRRGSGNRGGTFYQFLALFLTYSSIAVMLAPLYIEAYLNEARENAQPGAVAGGGPQNVPANANANPPAAKASPPDANQPDAAKAAGDQKLAAKTEGVGENAPAAQQVELPALLASSLFLLVVAVGFLYALPVLAGSGDLISALIYCFALWEAWKINKTVQLEFNGPFRVKPEGTGVLEPEVVDDDT
jgi:hypothetical protein